MGMHVNRGCPFCDGYLQDIGRLFRKWSFNDVWSIIADFCHIPINSNMFLDWINLIWKYENAYSKLRHKLERNAGSIWTYRNNVISLQYKTDA